MPGVRAALALAALALAALGLATPAAAEIRALAIGINAYDHIGTLQGAVNDAQDVAHALSVAGVTDLTLLLDGDASAEAIRTAWSGVMDRAAPGDVLLLHYAGHGGVIPARGDDAETDRTDEILMLSGFDYRDLREEDLIVDDELAGLLGARSDVTVLFIADTCHSGTMNRLADPRVAALPTRSPPVPADFLEGDLQLSLTAGDIAEDDGAGNVLYFGAVRDNELVREFLVDGRVHGLLSWSLGRAIEGAGDADGDGWLSERELRAFISEAVERHSSGLQRPQVFPDMAREARLLPVSRLATADPSPVTVALINAAPSIVDQASRLLGPLMAPPAAIPGLIWDVRTNQIIEVGEPVAFYPPDGMTFLQMIAAVRAVAEKYALVDALRRMAMRDGLVIQIAPDAGVHPQGTNVALTITGHRHETITLLNLASTGQVQLMFPTTHEDRRSFPIGAPIELTSRVTPPFGADHLVAVASARPLADLHAVLARPGVTAGEVLAALERAGTETDLEVGVLGAYSRP